MKIEANPAVARLHAYVPGEQPREPGFIKLNTNESPYPPAPEVLDAVRSEIDAATLNKYPDPDSTALRKAISESLGVAEEELLVGNGSDEVLRLLCHAFLRPGSGDSIGQLNPSYSLYTTLAAMFGFACERFDVKPPSYAIPEEAFTSEARIFFLANPNPPLGTWYPNEFITRLAGTNPDRVVVVDEAYVDFAKGNALDVYRQHENVVITRTFSKSYSLAGMRVGFVIARESIIAELAKIKDSYNINRASQAAALAAWKAAAYYRERNQTICHDRVFLIQELRARGFEVPASHGNFVFARRKNAAELYRALKARKILVRYFDAPGLRDGVRITIGTRDDLKALLSAIDAQ
jgi:histidinol-phosphate aminotransferase